MKKYIPVDFDEKGNVILGNAKNTPTSNGFIPTTWTPGGGSEDEGNGIKSITITPAIETTPALDSLFPFYWDEAQAEDGWVGFDENVTASSLTDGEYAVTVTPTSNEWLVKFGAQVGEKGQPLTFNATARSGFMIISVNVETEDGSEGIDASIRVTTGQ